MLSDFFVFKCDFSQEITSREIGNLPTACISSEEICPLHRNHQINYFSGKGILVVVRVVPYQTPHLKMLAMILMIKQMLILLTQKHACLRKGREIKQS